MRCNEKFHPAADRFLEAPPGSTLCSDVDKRSLYLWDIVEAGTDILPGTSTSPGVKISSHVVETFGLLR